MICFDGGEGWALCSSPLAPAAGACWLAALVAKALQCPVVPYYVKSGDKDVEGPYEEAALLAAITQRIVSGKALVNRAGAATWEPIESCPPFSEALGRRGYRAPAEPRGESSAPFPQIEAAEPSEPLAPRPSRGAGVVADRRWKIAGVIGVWVASMLLGAVVGLLVYHRQLERAEDAERRAALEARFSGLEGRIGEVKQEIIDGRAAKFVAFESTTHSCRAINSEASCSITNATDEPIVTCWEGQLVLKSAIGVSIKTLPVCTGRIAPRETRALDAPWLQAHADTICKSAGRFGDTLDWSVCDFKLAGVQPTH